MIGQKVLLDKERQELHCHVCDNYVQFDIDLSLDGKHVLRCPACCHEHCRVVKKGVITGDRWDSRNGDLSSYTSLYMCGNVTASTTSTYDSYLASATTMSTKNPYLYQAWMASTAT